MRLGELSREEASALLRSIADSRFKALGQLMLMARMSVLSMYYDSQQVWPHIDYEPLAFMRERVAVRRRILKAGGKHVPVRPEDVMGPYSDVLRTELPSLTLIKTADLPLDDSRDVTDMNDGDEEA